MAYTTIDNPGLFFNTVTYTGNGTTDHAITGVGFQPDWTWLKKRSNADDHILQDVVRGPTKYIISNSNAVEGTYAEGFKSFDSDGFTLGNANNTNQNTHTFAAWNWKAGESTSSNGDGTITSTVSVNSTSGFSIVSYAGTGVADKTVGHGLGATPAMIIIKNRVNDPEWRVWHQKLSGPTYKLRLNGTEAQDSSATVFNGQSATTFTVGTDPSVNGSGNNIIAYCFKEVKGYSKFGSYTGNGSTDGTFVYTGFKPAFVINKRIDSSTGGSWILQDNKRGDNVRNPVDLSFSPTNNQSESDWGDTFDCDYLSNGFKWRMDGTAGYNNTSAATYIYLAFAESPFVTAGTKAAGTAR